MSVLRVMRVMKDARNNQDKADYAANKKDYDIIIDKMLDFDINSINNYAKVWLDTINELGVKVHKKPIKGKRLEKLNEYLETANQQSDFALEKLNIFITNPEKKTYIKHLNSVIACIKKLTKYYNEDISHELSEANNKLIKCKEHTKPTVLQLHNALTEAKIIINKVMYMN
jgi:hypothetical protein